MDIFYQWPLCHQLIAQISASYNKIFIQGSWVASQTIGMDPFDVRPQQFGRGLLYFQLLVKLIKHRIEVHRGFKSRTCYPIV